MAKEMKKAISYSLFGFGKGQTKYSYAFNSYLRGFMANVRVNRIIYPDWITVVHLDKETYTSKFKTLFDWLIDRGLIEVVICESNEVLCRAMLWRMKPVFERIWDESAGGYKGWKYSHVLCRDTDSICTFREAQAVSVWLKEKKSIHCITDSISHNIAMMGGMIGISTETFADRLGIDAWDKMMNLSIGIDYTRKGADQDFMNKFIYPKLADSATEHFVLGMVRNLAEGNGRHYSIEDVPIGVDNKYRSINDCAGHIGASGFYDTPMVKFLNETDPYNDQYKEIESQYPNVFMWRS